MSRECEVVRIHRHSDVISPAIKSRLERMAAIFRAIHAGELLAAVPECPIAQADHAAALNLINLIEDELKSLSKDLGFDAT